MGASTGHSGSERWKGSKGKKGVNGDDDDKKKKKEEEEGRNVLCRLGKEKCGGSEKQQKRQKRQKRRR